MNERTPRRETSTAKLPVIDTLLQSATVGVFHAFGIATAPLPPAELPSDALYLEFPVGIITFKAPGIHAALLLSLPRALSARLVARQGTRADSRDLLRELTNLIMGRLKNRLTLYQVTLASSLPVCRERSNELEGLLPKVGPFTAYRFRTLDGEILLALKGSIDESRLTYSSTIQINAEGDIIVF
ncbi:MAG TPA: hypothetical protein VF103_07120 [Polyangiaceae bacterium]